MLVVDVRPLLPYPASPFLLKSATSPCTHVFNQRAIPLSAIHYIYTRCPKTNPQLPLQSRAKIATSRKMAPLWIGIVLIRRTKCSTRARAERSNMVPFFEKSMLSRKIIITIGEITSEHSVYIYIYICVCVSTHRNSPHFCQHKRGNPHTLAPSILRPDRQPESFTVSGRLRNNLDRSLRPTLGFQRRNNAALCIRHSIIVTTLATNLL